MHSPTRILIITGLSGAGKTVVLRALEDIGFHCIDNFPPQLLQNVIKFSTTDNTIKKFAIGVDVREKGFLNEIEVTINSLRNNYNVEVIFLEAEQSILIRRFKETRRPHPLSIVDLKGSLDKETLSQFNDFYLYSYHGNNSLSGSIHLESIYLKPLRNLADRVIDTSSYTPHQLRSLIMETFGGALKSELGITLISFGYKFGIPQHVDLLFDIRFLSNPNFILELKDLSGLDEPVRDYVLRDSVAIELLNKLKDLLRFLIAEYIKEGKSSLTIGVGCTGGKHRSPVVAEELRKILSSNFELEIMVIHREL